jgi:hypothetical protein
VSAFPSSPKSQCRCSLCSSSWIYDFNPSPILNSTTRTSLPCSTSSAPISGSTTETASLIAQHAAFKVNSRDIPKCLAVYLLCLDLRRRLHPFNRHEHHDLIYYLLTTEGHRLPVGSDRLSFFSTRQDWRVFFFPHI